jgi:hypothetical protein
MNSTNYAAAHTQFSPPSWHFVPPRSKLSPQHPVCSQTPSVCVLPVMWEAKFHIHTKQRVKLVLCVLIFRFLDSRRKDKRLWTAWQQAFPELAALNFLVYAILICYRLFQILELCYIFKSFIGYLYIMILSCCLVTRHEHRVLRHPRRD